MKKFTYLSLTFALVLSISNVCGQNLIAVQNGATPTFYQQVDDAITKAANGDTIYIPGGSWSIGTPINKRLHLIGVGHHPDSTKVTFPTTLIGSLWLKTSAINGSLTGIYLKGYIFTDTEAVNYFTVSRCRISEGFYFNSFTTHFTINESVLEGSFYSYSVNFNATNFTFFNNIISANFANLPFIDSVFKNNIIINSPIAKYSLLENNIFLSVSGINNAENSTAKNNLFVIGNIFPVGSTNVGSNNIPNQNSASVFVNQEGIVYNYAHDYHLQSSCPGKNAGTDGTDVGIYGGIYPWKAGSVPANPHFQSFKVGPTTDTNGNLNVKIKVAAQDH
jgi:hypothetical protein